MPELNVHTTPLPRDAAPPPLDALDAAAQGPGDYALLHSGAAAGYSVLGVHPLCKLLVDAQGAASLQGDGEVLNRVPPLGAGKPLDALQTVVEAIPFAHPHAMVGWLGLVSYDVGRFLEHIPAHAPDEMHWPLLCFTLYRHYLVFDPAGAATAYSLGDEPFDWHTLLHATPSTAAHNKDVSAELLERQSPESYAAKIERIKAYIAAGDIYQANLAQRWSVRTTARPHDVFRRLCTISPAPYAACLRFHDGTRVRHVASASPELFLSVRQDDAGRRLAVTRPIKGTRPRDQADPVRDEALRDELLRSAKDHAELTMIVDLLRNDLGRVSDFGTVRVLDPRAIERHPTVWHTVATIESRLRPGARLAEILAALCPGGSITGAPKIRAMQIIEELEGFRRGLYCGNLGVIGSGGQTIALNIAIRTILFQNDHAYIYAGGGIVADSDPQLEYEETLHKAAALFAALGIRSEYRL